MEMDTTPVSSPGASNTRPRNSKASSITDRDKTIAQYNADARILADFEKSAVFGESFNYSRSVLQSCQSVPEKQITAYLSIIQRGGLIQPYGCMIAVEETSLKIIGYSENCSDLLGLKSQLELTQVKGLIGIDVRTLFTPSSSTSLANAAASREISFLNPICVYSKTSQNPFYAILHRIDVGIVIDLEPAKSGDPALSLAGAVQSQKLAVHAISRLQSLPGGDIGALCDTVVEGVQKLTGYDRVMAYKFHDDDHGEVVSELRRSDLEPYLGLHYPSTDIPQAARFLFKQNRVRMICDCHAKPIKIIQSEKLKQSLCLVNSTLRSPYGCHAQYMINMGSIASLVMAVRIRSNNGTKLWGLVVCHHTSPRYLPFPLRYACELLMQAFGLQLYMEFRLASQLMEKNILKTQTLIADMLLRDGPYSLVTQSPSIKDLIKCDGAALYYGRRCWLLGVTPFESQVMDIAEWLLNDHQDSTGFSTDTLADSGYPGSASLGDAVCGMVAARINSKDFLFWFRSRAVKEVKWAGAKHHPEDKDDGGKLHPRSSFNAFLEVVKNRSFPWEVSEINAIHTLQLIVRDSLQNFKDKSTKGLITAQLSRSEMQRVDELSSAAWEMLRLIETATVPIFGVDSACLIIGWNAKISELTGLDPSNAMGKSLVGEITHEDSRQTVGSVLGCALKGEEERDVELKLRSFTRDRRESALYIVVNSCTKRDYKNQVIGVWFVGQDITSEKIKMDKFIQLQGDYKAIIHSLNPFFPPIFASDVNACCSEWNAAMEKLTGWKRDEVIGKILPGQVFGTFCRLKGQDTLTKFMISLYRSILGQETEELPFGFFNRKGIFVKVLLTANKRADGAGDIIGCFCFLQIAEHVAEEHAAEEGESFLQLTELAYIQQEISNPLNGIRFIHKLLESSCIEENQKLFLNTCRACERQIMMILEDKNLRTIEGGSMELNVEEFLLGDVFDAITGQIMILVRKKQLQLRQKIREDIESLILYGDQIKLQLVLSDILLNVVNYAPSPGGWVEIDISTHLISFEDGQKKIHLQVRMTHPGEGLPSTLVQEIFGEGEQCTSHEGLGLNLSRELLSKMNGNVHYVREHDKCYFLVDLELQMKRDIPEEPKADTIDRPSSSYSSFK